MCTGIQATGTGGIMGRTTSARSSVMGKKEEMNIVYFYSIRNEEETSYVQYATYDHSIN